MSHLIQQAGKALSGGQFEQAMGLFDQARESEPDNAVAHYGWAESAFMRISMDMADDVPAALVMKGYKRAMELDEENLEYVSSFANFCLDCGRIPMAIKEYQRLEKMADLNEIPVDDKFIASIISFIYFYFVIFFIITGLLSLTGLDFITSISGAATSISNVGPGLGPTIGPNGDFSSLPDISKWILTIGMILGRLELFAILVLFLPSFWRN